MGTRADFYIGRGKDAEWVGSIAMDGYPVGLPQSITGARTAEAFKEEFEYMAVRREDATLPVAGWPWPWEDSGTTDYAYAFDDGQVWASNFGRAWFAASEEEPEFDDDAPSVAVFPQFSKENYVRPGDARSGMFTISRPKP